MAARNKKIKQPSDSDTTQVNPMPKTNKAGAKSTQLFTPSLEQQAIINTIKNGQHVAVNAVAGSGKTTTILGLASQCSESKIIQITYNRI